MSKEPGGNYSVYILESPEGKKYVGCTALYPWMRWNKGHGYKMNKELWADIQKFGWDSFKRTIMKSGMRLSEAAQMEMDLIADLKTRDPKNGYNKTSGGDHLGEKAEMLKYCKNPVPTLEELFPEYTEEEISEIYNSAMQKLGW